jgi:hypothetical protein
MKLSQEKEGRKMASIAEGLARQGRRAERDLAKANDTQDSAAWLCADLAYEACVEQKTHTQRQWGKAVGVSQTTVHVRLQAVDYAHNQRVRPAFSEAWHAVQSDEGSKRAASALGVSSRTAQSVVGTTRHADKLKQVALSDGQSAKAIRKVAHDLWKDDFAASEAEVDAAVRDHHPKMAQQLDADSAIVQPVLDAQKALDGVDMNYRLTKLQRAAVAEALNAIIARAEVLKMDVLGVEIGGHR